MHTYIFLCSPHVIHKYHPHNLPTIKYNLFLFKDTQASVGTHPNQHAFIHVHTHALDVLVEL